MYCYDILIDCLGVIIIVVVERFSTIVGKSNCVPEIKVVLCSLFGARKKGVRPTIWRVRPSSIRKSW